MEKVLATNRQKSEEKLLLSGKCIFLVYQEDHSGVPGRGIRIYDFTMFRNLTSERILYCPHKE